MYCIGITCDQDVSEVLIEKALADSPCDVPLQSVVYANSRQLIQDISTGRLHALVFAVQHFTDRHLETFLLFKEQSTVLPIVVTASQISEVARERIQQFEHSLVLRYPIEITVLRGVLGKMFAQQPVNPRRYTRYNVRGVASIRTKERDYSCNLNNLSLGGACCEILGQRVRRGDEVIIHVPVPSLLHRTRVHARAVWIQEFTDTGTSGLNYQQVGFQFTA